MRGLLIIDIQRDYFPGGAFPLVEPEAAAEAARRALDRFRAEGEPIVHVQHIWDAPDAPFFKKGTAGTEIHPLVAPRGPAEARRSSRRTSRTRSSARTSSRGCGPTASTSSSSPG